MPAQSELKLSKAQIYFPPKYTPDKKGRLALYHDIQRAAQDGGDSLTLWGKGREKDKVNVHQVPLCSSLSRFQNG
jgi:hypothetical protein